MAEPGVTEVHNVRDCRFGWIGSWRTSPLDYDKLTEADIGRTVIYRDHGRAEAGTLVSFRNGLVFACYSRGDTAAAAAPGDLCFGEPADAMLKQREAGNAE